MSTGQKPSSHLFWGPCPQIGDFCHLVYLNNLTSKSWGQQAGESALDLSIIQKLYYMTIFYLTGPPPNFPRGRLNLIHLRKKMLSSLGGFLISKQHILIFYCWYFYIGLISSDFANSFFNSRHSFIDYHWLETGIQLFLLLLLSSPPSFPFLSYNLYVLYFFFLHLLHACATYYMPMLLVPLYPSSKQFKIKHNFIYNYIKT